MLTFIGRAICTFGKLLPNWNDSIVLAGTNIKLIWQDTKLDYIKGFDQSSR